jgi:hypothetical protein
VKPETIRTSVDLPRALHRRLHEAAARKGCSARQLILDGIERVVQEEPRRPRRFLDLRKHPLVKIPGPPIALSGSQIHELIELP